MQKIITYLLILMLSLSAGACSASKKPVPPKKNLPGKKATLTYKKEPVITLYINETGEKKKINIEDYLQGVVAAEMDVNWPAEALAAQAILARTFTMKKISEGGVKAHGTDASTSVAEFQAYDPKKINEAVKKAVYSTRGKVVLYHGKYINAWFHADSGGKTASSAVEGLEYRREAAPYIKSVNDPGSKEAPPENKAWKAKIPVTKVRQIVISTLGADPGYITKAGIAEKGPSGRATKLKFNDKVLSASAFRLAVGNDVMRSTLLTNMYLSGGSLTLEGKGYGHGVGMSQWGAKVLAEKGKRADQIIKYFYKDVTIKKIWQ